MTFDDYARWAASVPVPDDGHDGVLYLALALAGESGELGDVLWSWLGLCRALDIDPADVLAHSRAKIDKKLGR